MPSIVIDSGHGGPDSGTLGNGLIEKQLALQITLYQKQRLESLGVTVHLTRGDDTGLKPSQRTSRVKAAGAAYCISNHLNSGGGQGAEVIRSVFNPVHPLANQIIQELSAAGRPIRPTPIYSRTGTGGKDYYFMHRETGAVVTYIVEYGFLDNAQDAADIKANWQKYAEAVVKAVCIFLKVPYSPPDTPQQPPTPPPPAPAPPADRLYVVSIGAYAQKENAEAQVKKAWAAGFTDAYIRIESRD